MIQHTTFALGGLQQALSASPEGASTVFPGAELDLSQYLTICGLLIALILGLAWGFRRLIGKTLKTKAAQRSLAVIDVLPLGGRKKLCVVRCYDRTFALGLGDKEVGLIAEIDPTGEASVAPLPERGSAEQLPEFSVQAEQADPEALRPGDRRAFARELLRQHAELVESELTPGRPTPPGPKSGVALSEADRVRAALRRGGGVLG